MTKTTIALAAVTLAACSAQSGQPGSTSIALACFHGDTQIACVDVNAAPGEDGATPGDGADPAADELRARVEDFYPSACFDGDGDGDGVPDFLDIDLLGVDLGEADRDELRCPRCNRGPGTQNDFRLEIDGESAELDRGKVFVTDGDQLAIPTPEGVLTIVTTDATEIGDGDVAPGAEIRVRGTLDADGAVVADRLDVLCPAPAALPPEQLPPDADPVDPADDLPPVS